MTTPTITNLGTGGIRHQADLDRAAMATAITVVRMMTTHHVDRQTAADMVAHQTNTDPELVAALLDRATLIRGA